MIGYKGYWYGKEVEGRFTDIDTLFISDLTEIAEEGLAGVVDKIPAHVYFCSTAVQQMINGIEGFDWETIFLLKDNTTFISIEVTPSMLARVPAMIRIHCHILLMITEPNASLLKETDTIKVVYNDYSLLCTTVHNMQRVTPDDYKFDSYE
jgi:hypothetical protein